MADSKDSLIFKFLANITGLTEGTEQSAKAIEGFVDKTKGTLKGLESAFSTVTMGFAAITALVGGGAVLGQFVQDFAEGTQEAMNLGRALGVSATEASVLQQVLQQANVSQGSFAAANKRMSMQLATGGEALKAFGIETKGTDGKMKSSLDLMMEVNAKLATFQEGTNRNVEGTRIYGRAWQEVSLMVGKVSAESIAKMREETEALNLTVTQEGVAAAERYRLAINDVGDMMDGVKRTIGQALIPYLSQLGEWFASIGPTAVQVTMVVMNYLTTIMDSLGIMARAVWNILAQGAQMVGAVLSSIFGAGGTGITAMEFFKNILRVVQIGFIAFRIGFEEMAEAVRFVLEGLTIRFEAFREAARRVFKLDFAGAKDAWTAGTAQVEAALAKSVENMVAIAAKGRADLDKAATGDPTAGFKGTAIKMGTTGAGAAPEPPKAAAKAKEEADTRLAMWREELQKKTELSEQFLTRDLAGEQQFWQSKLALITTNTDKDKVLRRSIETELFNIKKQMAQQARQLADEEIEQKKRTGEAEIAAAKVSADQQVQLGEMTALQRLDLEKQFSEYAFQLELQRIREKAELYRGDIVAYAKYMNELKLLEQKHKADLSKLSTEISIQARTNVQNSLAPITNAFGNFVNQMLSGTVKLKDGLKMMFQQILTEYISNFITKMVTQFITAQATKLAANNSFLAALLGMETVASATKQTLAITEATTVIPANAAVAASGAAASQASIPYVGPILAVAAFAAIMAMVMGSMNGFAVGSWEVPGDMFTKIHKGEMIVPEQFANNIRDGGGLGGSRGGGDVKLEMKGIAMPGGFFAMHRDELMRVLKSARRDFAA